MMDRKIIVTFLLFLTILLMGCAIQRQAMESTQAGGTELSATKPAEPAPVEKAAPAAAPTEPKTMAKAAEPAMTFDEEEAKAIETAKQFVQNLDGYRNQNGRDMETLSSAKSGCTGCWVIELRFTRDDLYYPEKTQHIRVNLELKDWKMNKYTFQ